MKADITGRRLLIPEIEDAVRVIRDEVPKGLDNLSSFELIFR